MREKKQTPPSEPDREREEKQTPPSESDREREEIPAPPSEPDLLTEESVKSNLHTDWAGRSMLFLDEVDSTNDEAKRRASAGAKHGLLVVGGRQSAGRGRLGRVWQSEGGDSIYMTLLLRPDIRPENASMLTLVMALAVRRALERTGVRTQIKWPNDVICGGKKMVGILTEMSMRADRISYICVGVGINVNNPSFPEELAEKATSAFLQTGKKHSRAKLLAETLRQFEDCYRIFLETEDLSALRTEYNAHLVNRSREVTVLDPRGGYSGIAQGVSDRGELLVLTGAGIRRVSAGEVSVRGVYGYI